MADYQAWKNSVLGKVLDSDHVAADNGQCTQVVISWGEQIYPGVAWQDLFPPVKAAKDMFNNYNKKYWLQIPNNRNDVNQLPLQGDILIFDKTPSQGYANQYDNPYGHAAVCDSASPTGYTIVQQNAPMPGEAVNDSSYAWKLNPCLGWLRPLNQPANVTPQPSPTPPQASSNVGKTLYLPKTIAQWHVYNVDGPYDLAHATHILNPAMFGGLSYKIVQDKGNGIYIIDTQDFGPVAIWTAGTVATIG